MNDRPNADEYFLRMAELVATRATCARRSVGCVLVNARRHVLATGYNGPPAGWPHCFDGHPCAGAVAAPGTSLDDCWAIHAEQNALLQCPDVWLIDTAYVTVSPCITCTKLLLNTGCQRVVFRETYADAEHARGLWLVDPAGRGWTALPTGR